MRFWALFALLVACFADSLVESVAPEDYPQFLERLLVGNPWKEWYYHMLDTFVRGYEIANSGHRKIVFVEIGVCYGTHVDHLLSHTDNVTVYGVDPYIAHYDPVDFIAISGDQSHFDKIYTHVMFKLKDWIRAERYHHKRLRSWDAMTDFEEGSIDIVFVDGDHTHRAVLTDMEDFWDKLRRRGIMLGDDYEFEQFGVKKAVDEFVAERNLPLHFLDNGKHKIWYIIKP